MSISLDQVTKRYQGSPVVNDVSLEVGDGEFYVLLGPSGSGKSTLLRAVAGLTGVDHGRISLHGRDVTHVSARERGVGLVFQHYALFRHMTVAENIEFALRVRRVKAAERRERRKELLRLVALEGMDDRLPTQLSGGQQQRIAVARALAHKPEVLLLDEPFGALDAKIREELRRTIRAVQRELGITTVLVTHDQEEAFALADRIGVMNLGRLLESGKPSDLYARPATRFVATFLGAANLLLARQTPEGVRFGAAAVNINLTDPSLEGCREHEVVALLRPEEVELAPAREKLDSDYIAQGSVDEIVFTGGLERVRVRLASGSGVPRLMDSNNANGEEIIEVTRTQPQQRAFPVSPGQAVSIGVRRVHILPTPLSSFTVCASSAEAAQELKNNPLLVELAGRMKTRVAVRVEPAVSPTQLSPASEAGHQADSADRLSGVCILPAGAQAVSDTQRLLRDGAAEVLILPRESPPPQRVLIYWADMTVRRATLAVAASLLRHLAAEAVYFGIMPADTPGNKRSSGVRTLLDARSEAQAMHGLEMRTELLFGDPAQELHRRLNEAPGQLLILGLSDSADLEGRFRSLVNEPHWPVLVVYRPALDIAA